MRIETIMRIPRRLFYSVTLLYGMSLANSSGLTWRDWTEDLFQVATKEKKLVVLDLEAVWCHWCHVMEEQTYSDSKVIQILRDKYLTVRVDQDSRPDLARRYEDYGWPATIFFDSQGRELAKRSGFIEKEELLELLQRLAKHPVPEKETRALVVKPSSVALLTDTQKKALNRLHRNHYDEKRKGFGFIHKFLFGESEELLVRSAWGGDAWSAKRAHDALSANLKLIDPAWGGVYQYSVKTWNEPHFEKIPNAQRVNLELYSLGYLLTQDPRYLKAALSIQKFLETFLLSKEGAFYTSQDADVVKGQHSAEYFELGDRDRRRRGIPTIDTNRYSRENGWFASGLADLYVASKETRFLEQAIAAVHWVEKNRASGEGSFRHGDKESSNLYLGDSLAMAVAFLKLYEVTGERDWLEKAIRSGQAISKLFGSSLGLKTSLRGLSAELPPEPNRDENIVATRFFNRLFHYSGDKAFRGVAEQAMRFVIAPAHVEDRPTAGVLLADEELATPPLHLTVVGSKKDPEAKRLFLAALSIPTTHRRVEWWDKTEGKLRNMDVVYPTLSKAAVFVCSENRCSQPSFEPDQVRARVKSLMGK